MKKIFLSAIVVALIGLGSCSKTNSPNANAQFAGTYIGAGSVTINNGSPTQNLDTIVITPSSSNPISVTINGYSSQPNIQGTVSGNGISISTQTVYYNGNTLSITSGSGTLTGNVMAYTFTGTSGGNSYVISATDSK